MKVLILGGSGMLGHKVFQVVKARFPRTSCTVRGPVDAIRSRGLFRDGDVHGEVDVADLSTVRSVLERTRPDAVVNCAGLIKQRASQVSLSEYMTVNGVFPRLLADLCAEFAARLIHFSTDCVFSGRRGNYSEADLPDADDPYGVSKRAGEVSGTHVLTLRTSFIGRELSTHASLLDWFLSRSGETVRGFTRAIFSGVTTNFVGNLLAEVLMHHPDLSGIYHVAGTPISKYDLLCLLRVSFGLPVEIVPDATLHCDRSLNGSAFGARTGIQVPSWADLVRDLSHDPTPYDAWRNAYETA